MVAHPRPALPALAYSVIVQATGFDGHARAILAELEGIFQVFEDVTEVRWVARDAVCRRKHSMFRVVDIRSFRAGHIVHETQESLSSVVHRQWHDEKYGAKGYEVPWVCLIAFYIY